MEQCCEFMQVARTTVQQIYASARKKLADVLVGGLHFIVLCFMVRVSVPGE